MCLQSFMTFGAHLYWFKFLVAEELGWKKTTEAGFQNQLIPFFGYAPIVVIFGADILYYVISLSTKFYNF